MNYSKLGQTSLLVSRLCFGALTIGPLQSKLPLAKGAAVILSAFLKGVNFLDTAELYGTYPYIKEALASYERLEAGAKNKIVIASKSYADSYEGMQKSIQTACQEIGRDHLDIFLLHEQSSRLTLKGHQGALKCLQDAKKAGVIKAAGVSTHTIEVVKAASLLEEVDVIHPLINLKGIGIIGGSAAEMLQAIEEAHLMGKGIYAMKALGGGHLGKTSVEAFDYLLKNPAIDSIAVGMQSLDEVALNTALFAGEAADEELLATVLSRKRRLLIEDWCIGCGQCAAKCPADALSLQEGTAVVNHEKCLLCGYCGAVCPEFCLKII
ncbi:MAG: aldo/keto reductase [Sporomusaceae bacterium]|jgi:aryl-alcohol dehydrogenase-like predicted oxidoreductase|nr:aldo/keto reductase [Sporomusaceae bacterium]